MRRTLVIAVLAALVALGPGCGSIFGLAFDRGVDVKSTPAGATLWINDVPHEDGVTPTRIAVWSGQDHVVKGVLVSPDGVELEGQTTLTRSVRIGIVFLDIVFTAGIGLWVDWLTGAMYRFDRDAVLLNLGNYEQAAASVRAEREFPPATEAPDERTPSERVREVWEEEGHAMPEVDPADLTVEEPPPQVPPRDEPPPPAVDPMAPPCEICDQPRGDISPCPHCGID